MKKIVILLSMLAMLTACSSEPSVAKDENTLPDGIMQPVEGTGAVSGGNWLPEVQQQSMPENMK